MIRRLFKNFIIVICDFCKKENFVVWDFQTKKPRQPNHWIRLDHDIHFCSVGCALNFTNQSVIIVGKTTYVKERRND